MAVDIAGAEAFTSPLPAPPLPQADIRPASLAHFMGVEIELAPQVLVPRQETELLAAEALRLLAGSAAPLVIDMCCGCGNLALAVAAGLSGARVWASDLTDETVELARRNAERLRLAPRVSVVQGDMFAGLDADALGGRVDLVVCNPPYISTGRLAADRAHLLASEPREAFDGGPYGISIHQRLFAEAPLFLRPGGWLACEFGEGQERQVAALIVRTRAYDPPSFVRDAGGAARVLVARKKIAAA